MQPHTRVAKMPLSNTGDKTAYSSYYDTTLSSFADYFR